MQRHGVPKCSIQGVSYGTGTTEIGKAYRLRHNLPIEEELPPRLGEPKTPNVNFRDPDPADKARPHLGKVLSDAGHPRHQNVHEFFLSLALNHEVLPEVHDGQMYLSASNPDEAALVYAAQHFGRGFHERHMQEVGVKVDGQDNRFTILHNLEFASARARSSVIVRQPDGTIMLFTKGADNKIKARLSPDARVNPPEVLLATMRHLSEFVDDGLRTLLCGQRVIPEAEYAAWAAKMHKAEIALQAAMEHPNIVKIYDLCYIQDGDMLQDMQFRGKINIVMELVGGVSRRRPSPRRPRLRPPPPPLVVLIVVILLLLVTVVLVLVVIIHRGSARFY